jgi:hypothetical protein
MAGDGLVRRHPLGGGGAVELAGQPVVDRRGERDAAGHHVDRPRRGPQQVEGEGEAARIGRVVAQVDRRVEDRLAQPLAQEGEAAVEGVGGERLAVEQLDEQGRRLLGEQEGAGPLGGRHHLGRPLPAPGPLAHPLGIEAGERPRGRHGPPGARLAPADHLDPRRGDLGGPPQAAAGGHGDPPVGPAEPGGLPLAGEALQHLAGAGRRHARQFGVEETVRVDGGGGVRRIERRRGGGGEARLAEGLAHRALQVGKGGGTGAVHSGAAGLAHPHQHRALVELVVVAPPLPRALLAAAHLQPGDLRRLGRGGGQRVLQT